MAHREEIFWRCMGAAAPLRLMPGGETRPAFASEDELQVQVRNVR